VKKKMVSWFYFVALYLTYPPLLFVEWFKKLQIAVLNLQFRTRQKVKAIRILFIKAYKVSKTL